MHCHHASSAPGPQHGRRSGHEHRRFEAPSPLPALADGLQQDGLGGRADRPSAASSSEPAGTAAVGVALAAGRRGR